MYRTVRLKKTWFTPFLYKIPDKNIRFCALTLLTATEEKYPFLGFQSFHNAVLETNIQFLYTCVFVQRSVNDCSKTEIAFLYKNGAV